MNNAVTGRGKASYGELIESLNLTSLTPDIDISDEEILIPDVNRPGLALAGFFENFSSDKIQVVGRTEMEYLSDCSDNTRVKKFENIFLMGVPCMIFCKGLNPGSDVLQIANEYEVPIFATQERTSVFISKALRWLDMRLAPCQLIHGVLIDIYGEGVLIRGESGVGKSETALELINRGHRIITDDAVEVRKIDNDKLVGQAPEMTKNFIELRGVGIVDIKALFGVQSVREKSDIDIIIHIEKWNPDKSYDRIGLDEEYEEIMGVKIVSRTIPIRPGRNVATILETAAINHRQKKMGYNAAEELYKRIKEIKEAAGG